MCLSPDVVRYLVSLDCDVNHQSTSGKTALWKAAVGDWPATVAYLLSAGADPSLVDRTGCTVLMSCLSDRLHGQFRTLLPVVSPSALARRDVAGNTPLHAAATAGHVAAARMLLERARDHVHARNESGNTPLHHAALRGHVAMVVCLLNAGAAVDARNAAGRSALYLAMLHRWRPAALTLHEAGATLSTADLVEYATHEAVRYPEKRDLLQWAVKLFNSVRPLTDACRLTVRRRLVGSDVTGHVTALRLPNALKRFLLYHDDNCGEGQLN